MAAEHQLKAANAYIGVARAAFFPRISLTALVGTASASLSGLFSSGSDSWTFSPKVSMPIFDARTHAALRVSQVDQQIVLTQYQKAIQGAFREVADALAVKGTIDQQTEDTYNLALARYNKGIDDFLSVSVAQRSLYGAQQVLVGLRMARIANQVQLYAVLGGGSDVAN